MIRTSKRLARGLNKAGEDFSKKFLEKGRGSKEKMDREFERDCNEVINAISGWLR